MAKQESQLNIQPNVRVQQLDITRNFERIITPSRILISGPSLCGKSNLILKLIEGRNEIFSSKFHRIIYAFPEHSVHLRTPYLTELNQVSGGLLELHEGMPILRDLRLLGDAEPKLLGNNSLDIHAPTQQKFGTIFPHFM
jgi:hypothetical protein